MRGIKKTALVVALVFLEIIFLAWALGSNRPLHSFERAAFTSYQQDPTPENKHRWLREQQVSGRDVRLRKFLGYSLGVANLCLIVFVLRHKEKPA